jgi:predicted MPP superfamily phosphohydrolase
VIDRVLRSLPDLILLAAYLAAQFAGIDWLLKGPARRWRPRFRTAVKIAGAFSILCVIFASLDGFERFARFSPLWLVSWGRGVVMGWALVSLAWGAELLFIALVRRWRASKAPHAPGTEAQLGGEGTLFTDTRAASGSGVRPHRREFLKSTVLNATHAALFAAPAGALGYGVFVERTRFQIREQRLVFPDLPPDLDGLRIVQLTDIHMGPFLNRRDLDRAVAMANETKAQLALVTGDLISVPRDPLLSCLDSLRGLRAEAGIYGCMGNHERFARTERATEIEGARRGLRFLRQASAALPFGSARLNLVGVDYQRFGGPYLTGAEYLLMPGAFNILLSHNPDVFPVAAAKGFPLTVSGHTHGGQVRVEILQADLNVARFYTPYVDGVYRHGSNIIYVSRGIGTIGLPARLGAPPEINLLQLCRT